MGLTHFLYSIVTQGLGALRLSSRFCRKAASGHSVCACNPSQAFSSLQMPLLLMLVSHFLHHLLFLKLSQLPTLWVLLHLPVSPTQSSSWALALYFLPAPLHLVFSHLNLNVLFLPNSFHAPGSPRGGDQAACCL